MSAPELTPYLDTAASREVDSKHLEHILQELPQQIETAQQEMAAVTLPPAWQQVSQVVFCGMGGSAIGAEVASDLPVALRRKPVLLVRDYELPAWAGPSTLVAVASYSGETEEALACFRAAQARDCQLFVVTGGGQLGQLAKDIPVYRFTYEAPPRDSFGYLFVPLLRLLVAADVLQASEADLIAAVNELKQLTTTLSKDVPTAQNRAKQLAYQLFDHIPIIIGSTLTQGVARRWKNQFNEHAKVASFAEPLPEANHNTVEGFELPVRFRDDALAILLTTSFDNTEIQKRQRILAGYLKRRGVTCEVIEGSGEGQWAEKLSLLCLGDWVSYYLALLGRVDPEAIPAIQQLKGELRQG